MIRGGAQGVFAAGEGTEDCAVAGLQGLPWHDRGEAAQGNV